MQAITTIGLDIAKSVFQVHGIDTEGNVLIRHQLSKAMLEAGQRTGLRGLERCRLEWKRQVSSAQALWPERKQR